MGGRGLEGIDGVVLGLEDRVAQLERQIRRLTSLEFEETPFFPTVVSQAEVDGGWGPTSASTELIVATLVVPELSYATLQYTFAHTTFQMSVAGDVFDVRIREDSVSGAVIANGRGEAPANFDYITVALDYSDEVEIPAGTAKTYVLTVDRLIGSGTATGEAGSGMTGLRALILPDLP